MTEAMRSVMLRNGYQHAEPLVRMTGMALRNLLEKNPMAFYEFVALCRDSSHKLFGNTEEVLRDLRLIEAVAEGCPVSVHAAIQEITLAATEGELLELRLVDPLAPTT